MLGGVYQGLGRGHPSGSTSVSFFLCIRHHVSLSFSISISFSLSPFCSTRQTASPTRSPMGMSLHLHLKPRAPEGAAPARPQSRPAKPQSHPASSPTCTLVGAIASQLKLEASRPERRSFLGLGSFGVTWCWEGRVDANSVVQYFYVSFNFSDCLVIVYRWAPRLIGCLHVLLFDWIVSLLWAPSLQISQQLASMVRENR